MDNNGKTVWRNQAQFSSGQITLDDWRRVSMETQVCFTGICCTAGDCKHWSVCAQDPLRAQDCQHTWWGQVCLC